MTGRPGGQGTHGLSMALDSVLRTPYLQVAFLRTGMPGGPDEDGAATCRPVPAHRGRPA